VGSLVPRGNKLVPVRIGGTKTKIAAVDAGELGQRTFSRRCASSSARKRHGLENLCFDWLGLIFETNSEQCWSHENGLSLLVRSALPLLLLLLLLLLMLGMRKLQSAAFGNKYAGALRHISVRHNSLAVAKVRRHKRAQLACAK